VPRLRGIILATLSFQLTYTCSITLLPLHLYTLAGSQDAPGAVGTVLAASAIGGALGALVLGWIASRLGAGRVAPVAFVLTGLFLVPQAWLGTTLQIAAFRLMADFFGGGILPALRTLLAEEAAQHESTASSMGSVYGLSQSASAGGMALGAAVATGVGTALGTPANFVVAGLLAAATGLTWQGLTFVHRQPSPEGSGGFDPL
jgi:MFS family permease